MSRETAAEITARADAEIRECLMPSTLKSFFLYAGAGSGKTRALVNALNWLQSQRREELFGQGRQLAVVTYTNAATDEIKRRIEFDPFVAVSTIHAFAWDLIAGFDADIRGWVKERLERSIEELMAQQAKEKRTSKASIARALSAQAKMERLTSLDSVRRFIYSPTGDNSGRDALNHAEVISMTAHFLRSKATLQQILINRFPVLFVDESQDTSAPLMEAILSVQQAHQNAFCVGLFGDTMQRIYTDGKADLARAIPAEWARPAKLVNFRCPQRVLDLINKIRSQVDDQQQIPPPSSVKTGWTRFFIANTLRADRVAIETTVAQRMAEVTGVPSWSGDCKRLILEHHMAASRVGFADLFNPLYRVDRYKTGLLDGTLPELVLLTGQVLELLRAIRAEDNFQIAALLREHSPILDIKNLTGGAQQIQSLDEARRAIDELRTCFQEAHDPTVADILLIVKKTSLFEIPPSLQAALKSHQRQNADTTEAPGSDDEINVWNSVLDVRFSQVERYAEYITGASPFGTHQGVKGLEFPHVMVIIDDAQSAGFVFKYEKLFGLKAKTDTDRKNEREGVETGIDKTRRLLYVTCSRPQESLAIVAYCETPKDLKKFLISSGWFDDQEVEIIG
jgi:DNA helicase-2/ATP-dependent DNA helicase PcrA